jgi:hypothetical protein
MLSHSSKRLGNSAQLPQRQVHKEHDPAQRLVFSGKTPATLFDEESQSKRNCTAAAIIAASILL